MFRGLSECKSKSSKIRGKEIRRWKFRREGLAVWVSIYELSTRALVKEHSLYSHDPNCFPKDSWLIPFMEGSMCHTSVGKSLLPAGSFLSLWLLLGYSQCFRQDVMKREGQCQRTPGKLDSFPHSTTKFWCDAVESFALANNCMFLYLKMLQMRVFTLKVPSTSDCSEILNCIRRHYAKYSKRLIPRHPKVVT